jgi:hypothetical protein
VSNGVYPGPYGPGRGPPGPPGPQGPPGQEGPPGVGEGTGVPEAPSDGNAYLRVDGAWSSGGTLTGSLTVDNGINIQSGGLAANGFIYFSGGVSCNTVSTTEISSPWDLSISSGAGYAVILKGQPLLENDPVDPLGVATKQYVDALLAPLLDRIATLEKQRVR